jgi:hypothetical protein
MMSQAFGIIAAFTLVSNAAAQGGWPVLRGIVLENTLNGRGSPNVPVSANPRGNFVQTNSDGTFTLQFPRQHPGVPITIAVQRRDPATSEEYVVVNDVQLQTFIPKDPNRVMAFVVCRKRDREEYATLFYKLKSREMIEATFNRRLEVVRAEKARLEHELQTAAGEHEELTAKIREQDQQIALLQQQLVDTENTAKAVSEQLAAGTAGENSERYKEAMRLLLDGDVDGALRLLDHDAIVRRAQNANKALAAGKAQLKQAIDELLLRAAALTTRMQFDEAEAEYMAAVAQSEFSFDANYWYARFQQMLHRQDAAIELFDKSRKIADLASSKRDLALVLTALGNTYADKKEFAKASGAHREAAEVYASLAKQDPDGYSWHLAQEWINEGIAERRLKNTDKAEKLFEQALMTVAELSPDLPRTLALSGAVNLNLGNLRQDQDRPQETYDSYKVAISAFEKLIALDPREYRPGLAQAYNNLGVFADEASRRVIDPAARRQLYAEAPQYLEQARNIRDELARINPAAYDPDYAQTLTNLGQMYTARQQFTEAKQSLASAAGIRRALVDRSPDAYRAEYANTLTVLGTTYVIQYGMTHDSQLIAEATANFETAAQVQRSGMKQHPEDFAVPLGESLTRAADVYTEQARWDDAQSAFDAAVAAYDNTAAGPTAYARFHTWSRIGYYWMKRRRTVDAIQAFERAQSYFDGFSSGEKQRYRREVLDTAGTLAALKATQK